MNRKEIENNIEYVENEIENEIENLKYLIDSVEIENINLINIHFKIKDLLNKKENLINQLYDNYNIIYGKD